MILKLFYGKVFKESIRESGAGNARKKRRDIKIRQRKKVTSKKQAIAIGLSEARKEGAKLPKKSTAKKTAIKE